MKFSDLAVIVTMYAICAFFAWQGLALPDEAQTYPLCLSAGLALLNSIFLFRCLWQMRASGPGNKLGNDLPLIFNGFLGRQFFPVLLACIAYLILMPVGGFYLTSVVFLAGVLLFLRVPKLHAFLTMVILLLMIYAVFSLFLKVPLPGGLIMQGV